MVHAEHQENLLELLRELVSRDQIDKAASLLTARHPADQADLIEHFEDDDGRDRLLHSLSSEQVAEVLEYLNDDLRADILSELDPSRLAPILDKVDDDVEADIIQDLS